MILEAAEEWNSIDTEEWDRTIFYSESSGFIATHKLKSPDNDKDATGGVYGENKVNELLAKAGKRIYRLPENISDDTLIFGRPYKDLLKYKENGKPYGYPDDYFDGQTWDIKSIKTANEDSVREHFRNGRKADNVIFYFNAKIEFKDFTIAIRKEIGFRKSIGKVLSMPDIYLINNGCLTLFWNKKGEQ